MVTIIEIGKALSNPKRVEIIKLIIDNSKKKNGNEDEEIHLSAIAKTLDTNQPTISTQVKKLKTLGLITIGSEQGIRSKRKTIILTDITKKIFKLFEIRGSSS